MALGLEIGKSKSIKNHAKQEDTTLVKFIFSKKATKSDEIFTIDLTL